MKLKKVTAVLCAVVCSVSAAAWNSLSSDAVDTDETIKIMSIGDSITDGYGVDGSYRKFMFKQLTDDGYKIDMVGPNWSWGDTTYTDEVTGETFTYDPAHCGYSGYTIQAYSGRSGILETIQSGDYLSQYTPDIVILQIGTNDVIDNYEIDSAGERLDVLATYILENISSDSALFITTIPDLDPNRGDVYSWFGNYRHSADWQTEYSDAEVEVYVQQQVDNYNAQVKALVESKRASGVSNVYFGDVNSVVTDVKTQLGDGVHPNNTGYQLMGNYWADKIGAYLSGETEPEPTEPTVPETTEVTTAPATEPTTEVTSTDVTEVIVTTATDVTEVTTTTTEITTEVSETDVTEVTTEVATGETDPNKPVGDVNGDDTVSVADASLLSQVLVKKNTLSDEQYDYADVNADGRINVFDFVALKRILLGVE
ncbi:MAG: SGNH/GDSL hydrolase family protein [Porcipelethomonas sp.]